MCFHCNLCFKKIMIYIFFSAKAKFLILYESFTKKKKRKEKEACWWEQRQSREHLRLTKVEQSGRRVPEWSREEPAGHGWSGSSVLPHLALVWRAGWPGLATQHQNFFGCILLVCAHSSMHTPSCPFWHLKKTDLLAVVVVGNFWLHSGHLPSSSFTSIRPLAVRPEWIFWWKIWCLCSCYELNWIAVSSRRLHSNNTCSFDGHVLLLFYFFLMLESLTAVDQHWLEFYNCVKVMNG